MKTPEFNALIVSLNYAPEPTGNAPYSTKLSEGLHQYGMNVRVLTGYPHYPEWSKYDGYNGISMFHKINKVAVNRLRHRIPSSPSFASRLHMELSFGLRACLVRWNRPNVVLAVSPALFATGMIVLKAVVTNTPVGVWVQDLYSRGLEETKGSNAFSVRCIRYLEGLILRSASGVSVIHERFRDYVVNELGVPEEKVQVIRNWSHVEVVDLPERSQSRHQFGWDDNDVIALHAGNMGVKQNLENVIDAARLAEKAGSKIRFILVGHGNQRRALEKYAVGIKNLTFMNPLPDGEFSAALQCADVLLVNELPGVKEMSVPSKLTSYFSAGRPIIAATEPDSATADEIRASGAGVQVQSGSPEKLLMAVSNLTCHPVLSRTCGRAGLPYIKSVLDEEDAISKFAEWLNSLARQNGFPKKRL